MNVLKVINVNNLLEEEIARTAIKWNKTNRDTRREIKQFLKIYQSQCFYMKIKIKALILLQK